MERRAAGRKLNIPLLLILAAGLFARLWLFGSVPGGLNQDEAFAGYEAWSLLSTGRDSAGYVFPVYLTAWGSGMNVLESLLMIPFIALFGLKVWVIRLPQLIVGCLSVWVLYLTGRRLLGERAALASAFLLAICPWHVLLSRWGLESNLAPGFLLFGLYFFLRGLEDGRFFPLSALLYGLSLYAYATVWPFVPLLLALQLDICAASGKLRSGKGLLPAGLLLFALALPLLLFLAVNEGLLPEIRTPFFSVPKLLVMRSGEISLRHIPENLKNLLAILLRQSDSLPWNSAGSFGLLYWPSLPLALLGLALALRRSFRRGWHPESLLLVNLLMGLLLGALISVNVNRVNILFIPLVLLAGLGAGWIWDRTGRKGALALAAAYTVLFLCFESWYFTDYRERIGPLFHEGLDQAVEAALAEEGPVYVSDTVLYPELLFYSRTPPEEFRETVTYERYPAAYLRARSFGRFRIGLKGAAEKAGCAILAPEDIGAFLEAGFTLKSYGNFTLALRE